MVHVSNPNDGFIWRSTEQAHVLRRRDILAKHPEVRTLFGPCASTKYIVLALTALQLAIAWAFRDGASYARWPFWAVAYFVGATANHGLFVMVHELTHGLGFRSLRANRVFLVLASNLAIPVPFAASFAVYHMDHHKHLGEDGLDTDLPTPLEARLFSSRPCKALFAALYFAFYALRPILTAAKPVNRWQIANAAVTLAFHALLWRFAGPGAVLYLLASSFIAGSAVHPCAWHFIAEHYVFPTEEGEGEGETYSYYGSLNWLIFNFGYHNEHHDFPNVPWTRLPRIRALAPEFYEGLPAHASLWAVTRDFVLLPTLGPSSRVKRAKAVVQ